MKQRKWYHKLFTSRTNILEVKSQSYRGDIDFDNYTIHVYKCPTGLMMYKFEDRLNDEYGQTEWMEKADFMKHLRENYKEAWRMM